MEIRTQFYIDGSWVNPVDGKPYDVVDPSTDQVCAQISLGAQADVDLAVAAATRALDGWRQTSKAERADLVRAILDVYQRRMNDMAVAISTEMGAPIDMAREVQAEIGAQHIETFIKALNSIELVRVWDPDAPNDRVLLEPVGVVGLITPWNWPMNQVTLKVIPAILAGCTSVLKPSEIAPLSSMLFFEYLHEAGVPAGVANLVNGDGGGVGTALASHPGVSMISFTGSTRAGKDISRRAADTLKRVVLELGGKGANVVFADAGIEAVVRGAAECFYNTGQSCDAPTRMLVERSLYDEAVSAAAGVASTTVVAQASRTGEHIGPLVSQAQWDRVQNYITRGIDEGARLVAGGLGKPDPTEAGYFVRPTVFADVTPDMTIAREEIFGPVLSITPFDSEEEAVSLANGSPYGLANYVQGGDHARNRRVARGLRSGMVVMNGIPLAAGAPFGGVNQSGRAREGGVWGIREYLDEKFVSDWHEGD